MNTIICELIRSPWLVKLRPYLVVRLVDFVSQVYRKELMFSQEGLPTGSIIQKEKKRVCFLELWNFVTDLVVMMIWFLVWHSREYLVQ